MKALLEKMLAPISKNPKELSVKITSAFPTFYALAEASAAQISASSGLNMSTSVYIKLLMALASRRITDEYKVGKRHTKEKTEEFLKAFFFGKPKESLYALSYDSDGRFLGIDAVGRGTVNLSSMTPRTVLDVLTSRGSFSVIIAHNHPGGELLPSDDDLASNEALKGILISAGIKYLGHYIVAQTECADIDDLR